jgi:hypothetical protein
MFRTVLCPSSGVFHCRHRSGICHTGLPTAFEQDQDGTAVDVEFHLKNKFEKLVHLVGIIIRNNYEIYNELFCHSIRL